VMGQSDGFDREAWRREAQAAARVTLTAAGFPEAGDRLVRDEHQEKIRVAIDALGIFWGRR
jgi:hypothetical protein